MTDSDPGRRAPGAPADEVAASVAAPLPTCRRCGAVRRPGVRFCRECGLDHEAADGGLVTVAEATDGGRRATGAGGVSPAGASVRRPGSAAALAKLAGLVWLGLAVASALGALIAFEAGEPIAPWAALSAALEVLTGLGLFLAPSWNTLTAATLWGVLSVLGTLIQVSNGRVPGPIGIVLAAGIAIAAALSFAARTRLAAALRAPDGPPG